MADKVSYVCDRRINVQYNWNYRGEEHLQLAWWKSSPSAVLDILLTNGLGLWLKRRITVAKNGRERTYFQCFSLVLSIFRISPDSLSQNSTAWAILFMSPLTDFCRAHVPIKAFKISESAFLMLFLFIEVQLYVSIKWLTTLMMPYWY